MKGKIWLWQLPLVIFFAFAFYVYEAGVEGDLRNKFLRESVFPALRVAEGWFTNMKFRIRGPEAPKNKIVIVEIDDDTISTLGRWPWHRDMVAYLIDKIFAAGAKTVALDAFFSETDPRVSDELGNFLKLQKLDYAIPIFETDGVLEKVIRNHQPQLITGWTADDNCQPAYDPSGHCKLSDPDQLKRVKEEFQKFSYSNFVASDFRADITPLLTAKSVSMNIKPYNDAALHSGSIECIPDSDGYIRRASLLYMVDGKPYPALALESARVALGEDLLLETDGRNKVKRLAFAKSGRGIDVTPLGSMWINFRGPRRTFQYIKAMEVMGETDQIRIEKDRKIASASKTELLKDAYVFLGITALGLYDMRAFPYDSNTPGVEGHANILDNLLSGDMLRGAGPWGTLVIMLLMTVGAILFAYTTEKLESIPALIMALLVFSGLGFADVKILFTDHRMNINTSLLCFELVSIFLFTLSVKYVLEEKNKKFIKGAFAKYVAPAIIDSIMKDPAKLTVGGEKRDLTIMFSDIRSFTTFSERLDPKQLAAFLNDYLGLMTDLVFENEGTLDKYIGDAVMAFWGAPLEQSKHALNSCRAAIKMMETLGKNRARFKEQYGVDVNIGIGINSGTVTVGNMGSDRIFEYTVIGDNVNLASRLEGLTKYYGVTILTTRFTFDYIQKAGEPLPPHRILDSVKVKGKKNAVELIQVLDRDLSADGLTLFQEGRALYQKREWDQALEKFERANAVLKLPDKEWDGPCKEYAERCKQFKQTPPDADWDGSWEMHSK